jgi:peptidylprolyl isomerase
VLALVGVAGCSAHRGDEPAINPAAHAESSEPTPTPGAGADSIGGAVSRNLGQAPQVALPKAKAPNKLLTKDIVEGTGPVAGPESTVTVRYVGFTYATGKQFHSTWSLAGPESFSLVGYVVGFAEGVAGMRTGGRREIVVPPSLAYGGSSYGAVGPNETLVFVVDLVKVNN